MTTQRTVLALVHHYRDEHQGKTYCLQIELGNDRAVTLTVSEKEPPSVCVWHGSGEHSFSEETLGHFRKFVAAAFEPQVVRATK